MPESLLVLADSLNNKAVEQLQVGNYLEARRNLVSGLDLIKGHRQCQVLAAVENDQRTSYNVHNCSESNSPNYDASTIVCRSVPLSLPTKRNPACSDNNDTTDVSILAMASSSDESNLCQHEYYNAAFYLPTSSPSSSSSVIQRKYSTLEILSVLLFNAALTYHKEGIDGQLRSYEKALYLYKRILSFTKDTMINISDNAAVGANTCTASNSGCVDAAVTGSTSQSVLLIILAACHNMAHICMESCQSSSSYQSVLDLGTVLEKNIKFMSRQDREFFIMNRFFVRLKELSCAQAA